jgi:hypothetical protein
MNQSHEILKDEEIKTMKPENAFGKKEKLIIEEKQMK